MKGRVISQAAVNRGITANNLDVLGETVDPPDDNRLRRVFTTAISLRNRVS